MIYVFLADGFEEIEAIAPIDILRRAGLDVITAKVGDKEALGYVGVSGSHGIEIMTNVCESEIELNNFANLEMIVLPGGGAGVERLYNSNEVKIFIEHCVDCSIPIGAICAAPSIPARIGYLKGVRATAFPTFRHYLAENGAILEEKQKVVTDGIFTTAAAAGVSIEFGLELVRVLKGPGKAKEIGEQILFY
ncbi:MAG: DJ-1/PfpI family protein [Oscillospiraceae bacterium]|nr:DJ-1/PfpI family protein [Oscillospiraceae bacterium]